MVRSRLDQSEGLAMADQHAVIDQQHLTPFDENQRVPLGNNGTVSQQLVDVFSQRMKLALLVLVLSHSTTPVLEASHTIQTLAKLEWLNAII